MKFHFLKHHAFGKKSHILLKQCLFSMKENVIGRQQELTEAWNIYCEGEADLLFGKYRVKLSIQWAVERRQEETPG